MPTIIIKYEIHTSKSERYLRFFAWAYGMRDNEHATQPLQLLKLYFFRPNSLTRKKRMRDREQRQSKHPIAVIFEVLLSVEKNVNTTQHSTT